MILYHGSNTEIIVPDLSKSKPFKDFGRGFYLTEDIQQAEKLAFHSVAYQLRRCKLGFISIEQMVKELKYAKGITFQYFFGTQKALNLLKRL